MKKNFICLMAVMALFAIVACTPEDEGENYTVKTLTFEGSTWDALIDSPQYGGKLLYGPKGEGADTNYYSWSDEATQLASSGLVNAWGSYCYWNGGQAISNYTLPNFDKATYQEQLSVCTKGGHGGSKNFCVHDGTGEVGNLPALSFKDGVARVIESMYVVNTAYMLNVVKYGDGYSIEPLKDGQYAEVVAYGYDAEGKQTTKATFRLVDGPNKVVTDWTIWDLTSLGEVTKVEFAVTGNVNNDYGFALPAYFAYDDVAVRFPKESKKK
ncbi:MAG: DUF4465 domain-containing protein [Bacteroidaceae bacterium]|nr:DUF4465 domain-containing protein [Bacteroidaceae bacterium]